MTGGSSGGPWFSGFDAPNGGVIQFAQLVRLWGPGVMYGPKFNRNTSTVYNAAKTANGNTIVGD